MARKKIKIVMIQVGDTLVEAKECTRCNVVKPLADFHKSSDGSAGGRQPKCKECKRKIFKKSYTPSENITRLVSVTINGVETESKKCTQCRVTKPLTDFHNKKNGLGEKDSWCKECQNERSKQWKINNPEQLKEYEQKRWAENKEYESQRKRRYYSSEKNRKRWKKWYKDNKDRVKISNMNRVASLNELPNTLTTNQLESIMKRFDNKCALSDSIDIELDHFIAVSTGHGGTTLQNIIPLDSWLNVSKKDKNPFEWVKQKHISEKINIEKFDELVRYLAELNSMSVNEYHEYVYSCYNEQIKKPKNTKGVG